MVMVTIWKEETGSWSEGKKIKSLCTCFNAVGICHTKDSHVLRDLIIDPSNTELFRVDVIRCRLFILFSACQMML